MSHTRRTGPIRHLASSWGLTLVLAVSALALWAFMFTAPSPDDSASLDLRAAPLLGDADAPLRLAYFFRADCTYCTDMTPRVNRLVAEHGDLVHARFVRVASPGTPDALVADACAAQDAEPSCLDDAAFRASLTHDAALADTLGLTEVPAIWLGRTLIHGAVSYDDLERVLLSTQAPL